MLLYAVATVDAAAERTACNGWSNNETSADKTGATMRFGSSSPAFVATAGSLRSANVFST